MKQITVTKTYYTKDDCNALDGMSTTDVIDILSGLEGTWMPHRPGAYYSLSAGSLHEAELDFDLLRACKAVEKAVALLKACDKAQSAGP